MDTQTTTPPRQLTDGDLFAVAMPDTRGTYCYLTTGDGDPPRTYTPEHANRYKSERAAKAAMTRARKRTPLKDCFMVVVPHPANAIGEARADNANPPQDQTI